MNHAELITRATAEAQRQGFALVAIYARPEVGQAITLCLAPQGADPWAVHRFSVSPRDALIQGGYHFDRKDANAEFKARLDDLFDVWHLRHPYIA